MCGSLSNASIQNWKGFCDGLSIRYYSYEEHQQHPAWHWGHCAWCGSAALRILPCARVHNKINTLYLHGEGETVHLFEELMAFVNYFPIYGFPCNFHFPNSIRPSQRTNDDESAIRSRPSDDSCNCNSPRPYECIEWTYWKHRCGWCIIVWMWHDMHILNRTNGAAAHTLCSFEREHMCLLFCVNRPDETHSIEMAEKLNKLNRAHRKRKTN